MTQLSLAFSKPTQAEAILADLQAGRAITPLDALKEHGCFRLAARINDLRNQGYNIGMVMVAGPMNNKKYAQYTMDE